MKGKIHLYDEDLIQKVVRFQYSTSSQRSSKLIFERVASGGCAFTEINSGLSESREGRA